MESARDACADDGPVLADLVVAARDEARVERGGPMWERREALAPGGVVDLVGAPGHHVAVGCLDDVVVGYGIARLEWLRDGEPHGVVEELWVEPAAREVGVGEVLLRHLVGRLGGDGCRGVDALVLPGARAAKNLFERSGFAARLLVMHHELTAPWPDPEVPG